MSLGPIAAGIDIGGTKMAVGIVDSNGEVLVSGRCATPTSNDPEVVWSALANLYEDVVSKSPHSVSGVGCACAGPLWNGGQSVSPVHIPAWSGFSLLSRLVLLTKCPVFVDNDVKALARAEGWIGAARGRSHYLSMVVSTGIGGGIVVDGRSLEGRTGNAGHIGHVNVVPNGRPCVCGSRGCLQAEASGNAIEAITGSPPAKASDSTIERTGRLVGQAAASVANLLDLSLVVIGGGVALGFGEPFFVAAQEEVRSRARLDFTRGTLIRKSPLGEFGGVIGAGSLILRQGDR